MGQVFNIISSLAGTTKRNEKIRILTEHKDNFLLRSVFELAYNPYMNFWIKAIPDYVVGNGLYYSLSTAIYDLSFLENRTYTGNAAIDFLQKMLSNLSVDDAKVIELIIKKDLNCGVSVATINAVWPKLIPEFKYIMKCHDSIEYIIYPAIAQVKYDGGRCIIQCINDESGEYVAFSSSGRPIELGESLKKYVRLYMQSGEMFDGELIAYKDGKPLDRKTSNGILSKALKGTIESDELELLRFIAWDIIDETGTIPYVKRFSELSDRFGGRINIDELVENIFDKFCNLRIVLAESEIVNTQEEAFAFYELQLSKGLEGAVIKNYDGKWQGKRVKHQGKMKNELECDILIVSWEPHSKDKNKLGSFILSADDANGQTMYFNVGSGISADMRSKDPKSFIGKIATVRYNSVVKNKKDPSKFTLYIPRIIEIRDDKTICDSVERILSLETPAQF